MLRVGTLTACVIILATRTGVAQRPLRGCAVNPDATENFAMIVKANIVENASHEWHGLKLAIRDTATVRVITSDSVCDAALAAVRRLLTDPASRPDYIFLLAAGPYLIAQAGYTGNPTSEAEPRYFLDRSLTTLYYPCPNGRSTGCK